MLSPTMDGMEVDTSAVPMISMAIIDSAGMAITATGAAMIVISGNDKIIRMMLETVGR